MSKTLEELGYEKEDILDVKEQKIGVRFWDRPNGETITIDGKNQTIYKPYAKITMEELKAIYKYCEDNKWI